MFDDLNQQNNPGQTGQKAVNIPVPAKAEDIFAETEPVLEKPAVFQPIISNDDYAESEPHNGKVQKIFFLLIALFGFSLLGTGGYFGYKYFSAKVLVQNNEIKESDVVTIQDGQIPPTSLEKTTDVQSASSSLNVSDQAVDSDNDGLSDEEEQALGMRIDSSDTDNDNLSDRQEIRVYKTDPKNPDTDNDGVSDSEEIRARRNPNGEGDLLGTDATSTPPVTGGDSMIDFSTEGRAESPKNDNTVATASESVIDVDLDSDNDGLTDVAEKNTYKTNPLISDTDGDGYSDGTEVSGGHDPLIRKSAIDVSLDSDQDGLNDVEEKKYKTDPLNSDTDGDGYFDGAEVKGGFNPVGAGKLVL